MQNFFRVWRNCSVQVFDKVVSQIQSMNLPVVAVSLTAIPRPNTPVILMLYWHGFARPQTPLSSGAERQFSKPVGIPGSALQLSDAWLTMEHLDDAMLHAAWQLGAWDLVREERRGCDTAGASDREALECRQAFAEHPFEGPADEFMLSEAPDREDLMRLGARVGYVRWQFRPVKSGLWSDSLADETLQEDGSRKPPCPVAARPIVGTRLRHTRYCLGHTSRIVLI
jgi:hypothetical protein